MQKIFINNCLKFITIFQLLVASTLILANQNAVDINPDTPAQVLGKHMELLIDEQDSFSFDTVKMADNWQQVEEDSIIGGFTRSVYWVRFTVQNTQKKDQHWVLEVDYPIIDFIELYQPDKNGTYTRILAGDQYPFHQRPIEYHNVAFPIKSPAETSQTFYVKFKTESSMYISLNMLPNNTFTENLDGKLIVFGNEKGGSGKTTTAFHVAIVLIKKGLKYSHHNSIISNIKTGSNS